LTKVVSPAALAAARQTCQKGSGHGVRVRGAQDWRVVGVRGHLPGGCGAEADPDDPSNVFVVFEWSDLDGARRFATGLETHEAAEWATLGIWSLANVTEEVLEFEA
jgi:hypothetical protein